MTPLLRRYALPSRFDTITWVHTVSQSRSWKTRTRTTQDVKMPHLLPRAVLSDSGKNFSPFLGVLNRANREALRFQEHWNAIHWECVVWERTTQCGRILKFPSTEKSILFALNVRGRKFKIDAGCYTFRYCTLHTTVVMIALRSFATKIAKFRFNNL